MEKIQTKNSLSDIPTSFRPLILVMALMLSACVARTQEFHCVMQGNTTQTFEMSMTPTSLMYQSSRLSFQEEKGAQRFYASSDGRLRVRFNSASGELIAQMGDQSLGWNCKRYDPFH